MQNDYDLKVFKRVAERMGIPWNPDATEITVGGVPVDRDNLDVFMPCMPCCDFCVYADRVEHDVDGCVIDDEVTSRPLRYSPPTSGGAPWLGSL